jgi:glucose 1-dehydrogenase
MAVEWGPDGIRCNCVSPGPTLTTMFSLRFPDEESRRQRAGVVPLRRLAAPEDIADAICFLLGAESGFITGVNLMVDGGLSRNLLQLSSAG